MKINRKTIVNILLALVAIGLLIFIFQKINWIETKTALLNANVFWLLASFCISLFGHIIRGIRWNLLLKPAGYTLNTRRSIYTVLIGYFVNLGTSRGGEIARCAAASKSEKVPVETLIGTVITERIIDLVMLLLFAVFCLVFQFNVIWKFIQETIVVKMESLMPLWSWIVAVAILIAVGVILIKRIRNQKSKSEKKGALQKFTSGLKTILFLENNQLFLFYSVLIWVTYWISGWCVLQSLDSTSHLSVFAGLSLLLFSALGIAIPLPAGVGVYVIIAYGLEQVYGIPKNDANTFGILNLAVLNIGMLIYGGIAFLLWFLENVKIQKDDFAQS